MERECENQSYSISDERKEVTIKVKFILHFRSNMGMCACNCRVLPPPKTVVDKLNPGIYCKLNSVIAGS